jgi:hypothetical protein
MEIQTIQEAEQIAARRGVELTPEHYQQMYAVMNERQRLEQTQDTGQRSNLAGFVERFNRFYPKFLKALIGVGDVMVSLTQTVLIAFGVPLLLLMVMIVEQQRVYHGIGLFEVSETLAGFGASVLVLANLVFELLIQWKEHQAGYTEPTKHEFSLRLWGKRLAYIMGRESDWQPRSKSPAERFKGVLRVITFTILALALLGSMRTIIQTIEGDWLAAILNVISHSTLLQMMTWIGGLCFALAAVLSAQALSQYVAQKVIEVVAIMQSQSEDKAKLIAESTGAAYLLQVINNSQRQRRALATASAETMPDVERVIRVSSDHESSHETKETVKRPSPQIELAMAWLNDNPERAKTMSYGAIAQEIGVSKATVSRAMKVQ